MSPGDRKRALIRFADLLIANREELALLETLDMGKPISASMNTDVPAAANTLRWFGEAIDKVYDEIAPTNDKTLAMVTREPIGVVAAIVWSSFKHRQKDRRTHHHHENKGSKPVE